MNFFALFLLHIFYKITSINKYNHSFIIVQQACIQFLIFLQYMSHLLLESFMTSMMNLQKFHFTLCSPSQSKSGGVLAQQRLLPSLWVGTKSITPQNIFTGNSTLHLRVVWPYPTSHWMVHMTDRSIELLGTQSLSLGWASPA